MTSTITIPRTCSECEKTFRLKVNAAGYDRWRRGMAIQDALPDLPVNDRELLISGICGECFDVLAEDVEELEEEAEEEEGDESEEEVEVEVLEDLEDLDQR